MVQSCSASFEDQYTSRYYIILLQVYREIRLARYSSPIPLSVCNRKAVHCWTSSRESRRIYVYGLNVANYVSERILRKKKMLFEKNIYIKI